MRKPARAACHPANAACIPAPDLPSGRPRAIGESGDTWPDAELARREPGLAGPQALITTTPRRVAVLRRILAEPSTIQTTDSTYASQAHLPREFLTQIVSLYENTRLGRQEIYAEFLDTTDGVWFAVFNPARHVSVEAEYHPAYAVRCAIDAGTSRHTAAVFFQLRGNPDSDRPRVTVFADYHALDVFSPGFRAGSPRAVTRPGFPQIRACASRTHPALHLMTSLRRL